MAAPHKIDEPEDRTVTEKKNGTKGPGYRRKNRKPSRKDKLGEKGPSSSKETKNRFPTKQNNSRAQILDNIKQRKKATPNNYDEPQKPSSILDKESRKTSTNNQGSEHTTLTNNNDELQSTRNGTGEELVPPNKKLVYHDVPSPTKSCKEGFTPDNKKI